MARTAKESKGKLKKAERKAMEKKMSAGIANVKLANSQVACTLENLIFDLKLVLNN
jgi:hypothetical protein